MKQKINLAMTMAALGCGTLTILFATAVHADLAEFNAINAAARAARERGDNAALLANMRKMAAMVPGHPAAEIGLARALAVNGDGAGAVAQLKRIADLGFSFKASDDAAFQKMKDDPDFVAVAQRLAANGKGTGRGKDIIKLGLTGGSEGVAFSETTKSFLMGSSGSIYSYKLDGKDPAKPIAKAGGAQILGIRPDPASGSFLVCVDEADGSNAAVVRHNESSGEIEESYKLPTKNAYCNDIALLKNGSFAVTDSNNGIVFHLVDGKLEPLALAMPLYYPNGIASDLDKNRLYVSHAGGLVVHDMATGKSRELAVTGTFIGALDGMVWHKGSLVGVQNPRDAAIRLLRITPDADAQTAKVEVLLVGTDFPGHASTVAVAGDEAFVIGTSGEREEPVLIRVSL
ncbi:MAG TPA: tetratricopeptide repeat protein [Chthoniobacterales bacterium]|nr:tetratricopeptide repeat protein [Chthoniobacterales bacterium]